VNVTKDGAGWEELQVLVEAKSANDTGHPTYLVSKTHDLGIRSMVMG
jgi:hypothetical protein